VVVRGRAVRDGAARRRHDEAGVAVIVAVVTTPSLPLVLLVLAAAELGCNPACDEARLRSVAAAFEARTFEQREAGFDALAQACPTLPPTLARSLRTEFDGTPVEARQLLYVDRAQDPAWNELLARTCPSSDEAEILSAGTPNEREVCRLDRHGLLAADDVFVERDLVIFMLYEWLLAGRTEQVLARDVVWPLLSANASTAQLEAMCLHEGLACPWVVKGWGLELPRSNIDLVPTRGGTMVRVTTTELSVDQTPVLVLENGRPAQGAFVHHVAPALQQALAARAEHGRVHAEREFGVPWPARVELVADRATPFGTIVEAIVTATAAGLVEAELVVLGDELRAIPLPRPGAEPEPHPRLRFERPLRLTLFVHRDSVEADSEGMSARKSFPSRAGCEPASFDCHDLEPIASFVQEMKALFPHETEVIMRIDADVPLRAVVALVDVARGEGCHLRPSLKDGLVEPECLFFRPIVDAEPPFRSPAHPQALEEEPQ
jgi:biopolymer transport protein ExbD